MSTQTVFSAARDNTIHWALGYPVSAGHFAFTSLLVIIGGAFLFQILASTFNARRYAWTFAGPSWAIGLFAIVIGMTSSLVNQPEGMAGSSRFLTCLMGAVIAVVAVAGPSTMGIMSVGYGAAVSIWLTIMVCIGIVGAGSTIVGAGMIQGSPKVLHWQGEVSLKDDSTPVPKKMNNDRRILKEGSLVITGPKSGAIVMVRGHQILLLQDSIIRIASLDDEPRVTLERGRMFSRTSMAADRNMRFDTATAGFKVSNASVMLITSTRGTWAIVADGGIYAGRNVHEAENVVKKGQFAIVGPAGAPPPSALTQENKDTLARWTRYFENPFSEPNRALISGAKVRTREKEDSKTKDTDSKGKTETKSEEKEMSSSESAKSKGDKKSAEPEN